MAQTKNRRNSLTHQFLELLARILVIKSDTIVRVGRPCSSGEVECVLHAESGEMVIILRCIHNVTTQGVVDHLVIESLIEHLAFNAAVAIAIRSK